MKLSIITINYNNASGLEKTIKSAIYQNFLDKEFIIIDGKSTDNSIEVIKKYKQNIDIWVSEPDEGIYNAMNKGVSLASGEYCIFMNSGDSFYNSSSISDAFLNIKNEDIVTGKTFGKEKNDERFVHNVEMSFLILFRETISHQASFIKRTLLIKHPYDEKLKIVSDWKFFIETIILDNCTFKFCDIYVASIDLHGISVTNSIMRTQEREQVLSELFPPRVLSDYYKIKNFDEKSLKTYSIIDKTYRLKRIIFNITNIYIKLKYHFK